MSRYSYHQAPETEWPSPADLAHEPPPGMPLPPDERDKLLTLLVALQEGADQ